MGIIRQPKPVKLFIGMLSPDTALFGACVDILCKQYGPLDYQSEIIPWEFTDYYREEMGLALLRKFIFFERLTDPGKLPEVKIFTNGLEERFAVSLENAVHRRINLDPGYVTEAKVVLATTKDYTHRVFIGGDVYAEVTLQYRGGTFMPLEHTYPDYRTKSSREMFATARKLLRTSLSRKNAQ